jgi:hypothetical protein
MIFVILAFIVGIYVGFNTVLEYIYEMNRISTEEYVDLNNVKGF